MGLGAALLSSGYSSPPPLHNPKNMHILADCETLNWASVLKCMNKWVLPLTDRCKFLTTALWPAQSTPSQRRPDWALHSRHAAAAAQRAAGHSSYACGIGPGHKPKQNKSRHGARERGQSQALVRTYTGKHLHSWTVFLSWRRRNPHLIEKSKTGHLRGKMR